MPDRPKPPVTDTESGHSDAAVDAGRRRFMGSATAGLAGLALGGGVVAGSSPAHAAGTGSGRYRNKVVLITGATSGIGAAAAQAYAREGAKVMFCGRREERGAELEQAIRDNGGEATFMAADVREDEQMAALVAHCVDVHGGLDIAFNNAGIAGPLGAIDDLPLEGPGGYLDLMRTNVDGVLFAMRHELPVMRAAGSGVIVNTGSMLSHRGSPRAAAYAASKHAVIGLTRSAASADAGNGIRVVSVSPGGTRTELLRQFAGGGTLSGMGQNSPMGRLAEPEDVAAVVLSVTSPENLFLNGDDIRADGASSA